MSDLISREAVIDVLKQTGIIQDNALGHCVIDEINRMPIAYDVDKIVEELICDRCESCSFIDACAGSKFCTECHKKIIEIVKQGCVSNDEAIKSRKQLKEYQQLGTIEELKVMKESSFSGIELAQIYCSIEKLKEYKNLEEQGRLVKLQAKNNTTEHRECVHTKSQCHHENYKCSECPLTDLFCDEFYTAIDRCYEEAYTSGCLAGIELGESEAEAKLAELRGTKNNEN